MSEDVDSVQGNTDIPYVPYGPYSYKFSTPLIGLLLDPLKLV